MGDSDQVEFPCSPEDVHNELHRMHLVPWRSGELERGEDGLVPGSGGGTFAQPQAAV
jgi:hypothetical protein